MQYTLSEKYKNTTEGQRANEILGKCVPICAYKESSVYAGPRLTSAPPELLQIPPTMEAPIQDEPITE